MRRDFRAGFQTALCYAKGFEIVLCYAKGFQGRILDCPLSCKGISGPDIRLSFVMQREFRAGFQIVVCRPIISDCSLLRKGISGPDFRLSFVMQRDFRAGFQTVACRPSLSCVSALMENSVHRLSSPLGPLAVAKKKHA